MRNKRGSHVGFVVSFVIFVTFLVFIYAVLQPTITRERSKVYILDYLSFNLINASSSEVTTLTISVEESTGDQIHHCLNMQQFQEIPDEMKPNLRIENSSGGFLLYKIHNANNLYIGTPKNFIGLLNVYYSEDIIGEMDESLNGCNPKSTSTGVIKTYTEVFESNIGELNTSYYNNYEGLKGDLGIPEGTEFSFSLFNADRSVEIFKAENEPPPETISVYSEEAPIQYIGSNGELKFGFLIIKVW